MTAGKRILESQGYVDAVTSQDLKVRTKGLSTAKLSLLDTTDLVLCFVQIPIDRA